MQRLTAAIGGQALPRGYLLDCCLSDVTPERPFLRAALHIVGDLLGVKLGIRGRGDVTGDAKQGAKSVERVVTTIEAERELVEVRLLRENSSYHLVYEEEK
jgi:hypothetical protein